METLGGLGFLLKLVGLDLFFSIVIILKGYSATTQNVALFVLFVFCVILYIWNLRYRNELISCRECGKTVTRCNAIGNIYEEYACPSCAEDEVLWRT